MNYAEKSIEKGQLWGQIYKLYPALKTYVSKQILYCSSVICVCMHEYAYKAYRMKRSFFKSYENTYIVIVGFNCFVIIMNSKKLFTVTCSRLVYNSTEIIDCSTNY